MRTLLLFFLLLFSLSSQAESDSLVVAETKTDTIAVTDSLVSAPRGKGKKATVPAVVSKEEKKRLEQEVAKQSILREVAEADNVEKAVLALQKMCKVDASYPVESETAHLYFLSSDLPKAIFHFSLVEKEKLSHRDFCEYAEALVSYGETGDGAVLAEEGLQLFPSDTTLLRLALYANLEEHEFSKASGYGKTLLAMKDSIDLSSSDLSFCAQALAGNSQYDEALTLLSETFSADSTRLELLRLSSFIAAEKGNLSSAISLQKQYLDNNDEASANDCQILISLYEKVFRKAKGDDRLAAADSLAAAYDLLASHHSEHRVFALLRKARIYESLGNTDAKALSRSFLQQAAIILESKEQRDGVEQAMLEDIREKL